MLLAVDVGNTETLVGVFRDDDLLRNWRISTRPRKTSDEWTLALSELLTINGAKITDIDHVIIASVVPDATSALLKMTQKTLRCEPLFVSSDINTVVEIKTDNPDEVGADRITNAAAVLKLHGAPAIVVDFGTATTFDVISTEGDYIGGIIAPGIEISIDALFERAARLSEVIIKEPDHVIGRNTTESMQSGIIYGFAGQIDSLIHRIVGELGVDADKIKVIATGGLADLMLPFCQTITDHDPLLTLKGLNLLWQANR